jgi:hypothetical protein
LKKLGLDGAAHAFRHGNASLLDHLHAPMKVWQDRLGHADPRTAMGYTHVIGDDHGRVAEQMPCFYLLSHRLVVPLHPVDTDRNAVEERK